jgi:hypothetical protein
VSAKKWSRAAASGRDQLAAQLAASQESIIRTDQLRELGFTADDITRRVRRGQLFPLHRGVYAWGTPNLTDHALLRAAQWACGDKSFFSHATGAAVYGQRNLVREAIELTIPRNGGRSRHGLVLHRTSDRIDRRELRTWSGLRVSTFPRLLLELSPGSSPGELDDLLTFGARKRLFDPKELEAELLRHASRPGIALLKAAAARYRPGPNRRSTFEYSFDGEMRQRPHIPPYEKNVYLGIWEIDCLWRPQRLAVELDYRDYHAAIRDFDKDRKKDAEIQMYGYRSLRISEFLWEYEREQQIVTVEAMLGLREPVFLQRRSS